VAIVQDYVVFDTVYSSVAILVSFQFARLLPPILTYIIVSSKRLGSRTGSIATIVASAILKNALVHASRQAWTALT
jgi:hypothetical protein